MSLKQTVGPRISETCIGAPVALRRVISLDVVIM